jgi:hypothetical protein
MIQIVLVMIACILLSSVTKQARSPATSNDTDPCAVEESSERSRDSRSNFTRCIDDDFALFLLPEFVFVCLESRKLSRCNYITCLFSAISAQGTPNFASSMSRFPLFVHSLILSSLAQ